MQNPRIFEFFVKSCLQFRHFKAKVPVYPKYQNKKKCLSGDKHVLWQTRDVAFGVHVAVQYKNIICVHLQYRKQRSTAKSNNRIGLFKFSLPLC